MKRGLISGIVAVNRTNEVAPHRTFSRFTLSLFLFGEGDAMSRGERIGVPLNILNYLSQAPAQPPTCMEREDL